MSQHRQTTAEVQQNLAELLDWQFAERKDQAVAQPFYSGQGVDLGYGLEEAMSQKTLQPIPKLQWVKHGQGRALTPSRRSPKKGAPRESVSGMPRFVGVSSVCYS